MEDQDSTARALRESEELHRITLTNMSDAVFITDDDGVFTFICPNVDVIFGYQSDEVRALGRISSLLGRDLVDRRQLATAGEVRNIEHEIVRKDGGRRVLLLHIKQVAIKGGTTLYACRDISERYQVDRELRELSGRLINAHEQERVRLSRELHDNVAQRVGLLSVELAQLRDRLNPASQEVARQIATLSAQTREIGAELHRLSHELHPARLTHLGLEASIQGFCEDLAEAHDLTIVHDIATLPRPLADDATLCLYRIAQEALQNVIKHSGATSASVTLAVEMNEVVLTVSDNGAGFDPRAAFGKDTLGIVSMRERARLVRGRFDLWSRPGQGTTVTVRIPVREEAGV